MRFGFIFDKKNNEYIFTGIDVPVIPPIYIRKEYWGKKY